MDILLGIPDGDVTSSSFPQIKSFAQQFTNGLKLGNNDIRMGVFSYSDKVRTVMAVSNGISSSTIDSAIRNLAHGGGGNRKDIGIQHASRMFGLSPRSGVSKSLVLLTSGASSSGSADLATMKDSYPEMNIIPVAVGSRSRTDAAKLSGDYTYYENYPDLVSSGPFEITSKVIAAGGGGGATGGGGGGVGNLKIFLLLYQLF